MPKGITYYVELVVAYKQGRSNAEKRVIVNTTCVGYSAQDAEKRLKDHPEKLHKSVSRIGKYRDLRVVEFKVHFEMGQTMYCIDTGKVI